MRSRRRKHLKAALTARQAADVVWNLASERTFLALDRHRGWTADEHERWVAEQLEAALLPGQPQ